MSTLSEQDIRPVQLMAKQRIAALTDVGRMLSRYGEFVQVDCPACAANSYAPKFEKNGISYVECKECLTFTSILAQRQTYWSGSIADPLIMPIGMM